MEPGAAKESDVKPVEESKQAKPKVYQEDSALLQ